MIRSLRNKLNNLFDYPPIYLDDIPNQNQKLPVYSRCLISTVPSRFVGRRIWYSQQKLRRDNPGWSFKYFDNNEQKHYIDQKWSNTVIQNVFHKSKFGQMKSDIFRYCYLYENGGTYIDITKNIKTKLDILFSDFHSFNISFESKPVGSFMTKSRMNFPIVQYCLSTPKYSQLLLFMIRRIEKKYPLISRRIYENPKNAILEYTGPIGLMQVYNKMIKEGTSDTFRYMNTDYHNAINFSYPGSSYFNRKNGDYSFATNESICD